MPEIKYREEPIQPASLTGFWRSSIAQLQIYQDRPAPTVAFLLCLGMWGAGIARIVWPEMADSARYCMHPDDLFRPRGSEWRRYLLHALWPFEAGYIRAAFASTALLLQGYAFEYEVGSAKFAVLFIGLHLGAAAVLLNFRFTDCHISMEATLAAMAVVLHRANPKIMSDGLDKSIAVEWPIEPRWHIWAVLSFMLLMAGNFEDAFLEYVVGIGVGAVCALRDPDAWADSWKVARARSPGIGRAVHMALFMFVIMFMPLTTPGSSTFNMNAFFSGGIFSLDWLQKHLPPSPPLLHMALEGSLSGQALWILRLLVSFAFPLVLTPFRMWTRVYSLACVILIMYTMNSDFWRYPHIGFVALFYLVWAFWTLPNVQPHYKTN